MQISGIVTNDNCKNMNFKGIVGQSLIEKINFDKFSECSRELKKIGKENLLQLNHDTYEFTVINETPEVTAIITPIKQKYNNILAKFTDYMENTHEYSLLTRDGGDDKETRLSYTNIKLATATHFWDLAFHRVWDYDRIFDKIEQNQFNDKEMETRALRRLKNYAKDTNTPFDKWFVELLAKSIREFEIETGMDIQDTSGIIEIAKSNMWNSLKNFKSSLKKHFTGYPKRINYTVQHKKAFLKVEKELLGKNTLSGYLHDTDKLLMYILGFPKKLAHNIHIATAPHHLHNGKFRKPIQTIIDWESAHLTKSDKPLNAKEFYKQYYVKDRNERYPEIEEAFKQIKYRPIN